VAAASAAATPTLDPPPPTEQTGEAAAAREAGAQDVTAALTGETPPGDTAVFQAADEIAKTRTEAETGAKAVERDHDHVDAERFNTEGDGIRYVARTTAGTGRDQEPTIIDLLAAVPPEPQPQAQLVPEVMILPEPDRNRPTVALERGAVPGQPPSGRSRHARVNEDRASENPAHKNPAHGNPSHENPAHGNPSRDVSARDDSARHHAARHDSARHDSARHGIARHGVARQDSARADRALQDRIRQERTSALLETSPFWQGEERRTEVLPPLETREQPATVRRASRRKPRTPRRPASGLLGLLTLGLVAAFFSWVSAEPLWLAVGHGDQGSATVARCTGSGVTQRCSGQFTAANGAYRVDGLALLGVESAQRVTGVPRPARMVSSDSRQAYVGDTGVLVHLRWALGVVLVLICGLGIAGLTGARRLETPRARRSALLISLAGPLALLAGFLVVTY
jgi:hypothetical protein